MLDLLAQLLCTHWRLLSHFILLPETIPRVMNILRQLHKNSLGTFLLYSMVLIPTMSKHKSAIIGCQHTLFMMMSQSQPYFANSEAKHQGMFPPTLFKTLNMAPSRLDQELSPSIAAPELRTSIHPGVRASKTQGQERTCSSQVPQPQSWVLPAQQPADWCSFWKKKKGKYTPMHCSTEKLAWFSGNSCLGQSTATSPKSKDILTRIMLAELLHQSISTAVASSNSGSNWALHSILKIGTSSHISNFSKDSCNRYFAGGMGWPWMY